MTDQDNYNGLEIAVIGMSGRFPESTDLNQLWANLKEGKEMVSFFSDEELLEQGIPEELVKDPNYVKAKGFLSDAECFDAPFFGYTNKEADYMDPQFRVFHECVYNALEDAGYADPKHRGVTGLFAGAGFNPFWIANFLPSFENFADIFEISSLNAREYMTTRVAYKLDLDGPTMTVQTACSTSLVAVHMACQSLLAGEAEMALAGGSTILFPNMDLPRKYGIQYQEGMIISNDGHCRPFDREANGFMGGDGVGVVVLKRLDDAMADGDNILAVIKGSAINNDGSVKAGYAAPGTKGQTTVIEAALQLSEVDPGSIGYVETHGSGTRLGDPIELQALTNAYQTPHGNHCGIGSIKSNFGHLDATAGIAGFIKTVLTLKNGQIPASINFNDPNPKIDFENSPFYVNNVLQDWEANGTPRRAAVSSFGIGGTNAHMIMEEAPKMPNSATEAEDKEHLILLSAHSENALKNNIDSLRNHLQANPETAINDLAYTLQIGRKQFDYKRAITCKSVHELLEELSSESTYNKITHHVGNESSSMVFVFSGHSGQYVDMGLELYHKLTDFKAYMDEGFQAVNILCGIDLKSIIYPSLNIAVTSSISLNRFDVAQLSLFVLERAVAKLIMDWGVTPVAVAGYSFGEFTAAHIAGVMSLEDAVQLIAKRGELILDCEPGAMLSVPISPDQLGELPEKLVLAIDKGETCVLSGPVAEIDQYAEKLKHDRILSMKLPVERAIHSPMMDNIASAFKEVLEGIDMEVPAIPMVSNVTGIWVDQQITRPEYWIDHLTKQVEFAKCVETLLTLPNVMMMEVGPGIDLTCTLQKFITKDSGHFALNTVRPEASTSTDLKYLMMRVQRLWQRGVEIDWTQLYKESTPKRISLPGYAFDRHRYWFKDREPKASQEALSAAKKLEETDELTKNREQDKWYYTPSWQQTPISNLPITFTAISRWLVFTDDSDLSRSLIDQLIQQKQEVIVLRKGVSFNRVSRREFIIAPHMVEHYQYLVEELIEEGLWPEKVLHLWSLSSLPVEKLSTKELEASVDHGFYGLINLARELHESELEGQQLDIFTLTREMFSVVGSESLNPIHATILGAVRVLPIEFRNITCRQIDIVDDKQATVQQVLRELTVRSNDFVIAIRNKYKWVQGFDRFVQPHESPQISEMIGDGKVYLIVGGLTSRSNLGYILAKRLSETAAVNIVFLSRTKYPKRAEWDQLMASGEHDLSDRIQQIAQIEEGRGKVFTYEADITQQDQLSSAIEEIEADLGKISGVINVAGVMNDQAMGLVISQNAHAHFKTQFDVKVQGTINLYHALKGKNLDFCVLNSSLTSVMGPFAAYSAGNNFMDAFVHLINQEDDQPWLTINWDHLLGFEDKQEDQPLAINHGEILSVFERLLPMSKASSQVIICTANIEKRIAKTLNLKENQESSPVAARKPLAKWFYQNTWKAKSPERKALTGDEGVLVFMRNGKLNDALIEALEGSTERIFKVDVGESFAKEGAVYSIDPTNPDHYQALFEDLNERNWSFGSIYHLWNCTDSAVHVNEENVWGTQQIGLFSLLNLVKAITNHGKQQVAMKVVTNNMHSVTGEEEIISAEKASMLGVIKIAPVESSKIISAGFDVDAAEVSELSGAELTELVTTILESELDGESTILAARGNTWYNGTVSSITNDPSLSKKEVFKNNGTYLLTGGLGGMAIETIEQISDNQQANFILVDTKELPPRNKWKSYGDQKTDEALLIQRLQNIEKSGSRLAIVHGDISDYDAIAAQVKDVITAFGSVDGLFHIAGGIDYAGVMQSRSIEETQSQVAPKIQGALVLSKLLEDQELDFEVYFSSTGNTLPKLKFGQVGYNAGHEFLDVYAKSRRQQGKNAYVFNTNDWHGVGIAAEADKKHSYSLKNYDVSFSELLSINAREGFHALTSMLQHDHTQVIVSAYDINKLQDFINRLDFAEVVADGAGDQEGDQGRLGLTSDYVQPRTEAEEHLASAFKEIFGIEQVGIDDDFFELGGDSIKAISAISILQQKHNLDIPVTTFFEKSTIRKLAGYLSDTGEAIVEEQQPQFVVDEDFYKPFPVSPIQMAYIMGRSDQFDMGGISTNIYQESKIHVDLEALNLAFNKLLSRHPMLKIFFLGDGQQQFHQVDAYEIKNTDLTDLDTEAQQKFIKGQRDRLNDHLFDEKQWPLFDISTCTLADGEHYLFFCFDHLICDAASLMILVKEWGTLIKDINADLPELNYTYRDYIIEFEQQRNSPKFDQSRKYWLNQLDSFPSSPAIPYKTDPSNVDKPGFKRNRKVFSPEEWVKLKAIAKKKGVTPSVVICSAYAMVLSFWCNNNEVAINLTLFNRYPFHEDVQRIVGDFTLLVLLGIKFDQQGDFEQDVKVVQRTLLEALDNRFYDGIDFIRDLRKERQLGTSAVMPFVFTSALFDGDIIASEEDEVLGIWGQQRDEGMAVSQTSQVYIDCTCAELNGGLELVWDHVEQLFDKELIDLMFSQYVALIDGYIQQENKPVFALPQKHLELIDQVNDTAKAFPDKQTMVNIFELQVTSTPGNVALRCGAEEMTYEVLNTKANQLARHLIEAGVTLEQPVGLMADRSFDLMVGMFAILKAGGVYLPIAANNPADRIEYIVNDASIKTILTQKAYSDSIPENVNRIILEDTAYNELDGTNINLTLPVDQTAYIIYTSGSTGQPKGVMVPHNALVNRLNWMQQSYPLSADDRLIQKTPISFDVSVWELFWWGFEGASLTLLPPGDEKSPEMLVKSIATHGITTIHFVPSMFDLFLNHLEENSSIDQVASLQRVFCSGEELLPVHVEKFHRLFKGSSCKLVNLYGPTEATIDVSYFNCEPDQDIRQIPIGKPIDNTKLYILNDELEKVPVGVEGQLYISGTGVAKGYVNKPKLTGEKFISDPFEKGSVMYATGDRARYQIDGEIIYLGRQDTQVKLRGNRIELGEIENGLSKIKGIDNAVVMIRKDEDHHDYLCAYLVSKEELQIQAIRTKLSESLPEYMIPSKYQLIDEIPLTSNGKVNRKLLPDPDQSIESGISYEAPKTELQKTLVAIYEELLKINDPGIHASFFDLGGDSFKATFLITSIQKKVGAKIALGQIFKTPAVAGLAQFLTSEVGENGKGGQSAYEPITKAEDQTSYALSSTQQRLWIINQINPDQIAYNVPYVVRLEGVLDKDHLRAAFVRLIDRYEILRTSFKLNNEEVAQYISKEVKFEIETYQSDEAHVDEVIDQFIRPFDLDGDTLLRVGLIEINATDHFLMIDMHHIICDAISMNIMITEFMALYKDEELPETGLQYKDFAVWQNSEEQIERSLKHKSFWLNEFAEEVSPLQLPLDYPRPAERKFTGEFVSFELGAKEYQALKAVCEQQDVTMLMMTMSMFGVLLSKLGSTEDLVIGTPTTGRFHPDLEDMLGLFVNTLCVRSYPEGDKPFSAYLSEVKSKVLACFENESYPYQELVNSLDIGRETRRNPLFDVMFSYIVVNSDELSIPGLKLSNYGNSQKASKFDLSLWVQEASDNMMFTIEYSTELFKPQTIERIKNYFLKVINDLMQTPDAALHSISIIHEDELNQILNEFNKAEEVPFPKEKTVIDLLEEQVSKTPEDIALIFNEEEWSYDALSNHIDKVANELMLKGVKPGDIVGILCERSFEMMIGIFGTMKCGAAYLPIDPNFPEERITYMLSDSGAQVLLVKSEFPAESTEHIEVINLDLIDFISPIDPKRHIESQATPDGLAYVIYTSGSTGKPKGVMIPHQAILNLNTGINEIIPFAQKKLLSVTTFSFDIFVLESYLPLLNGGTVILANEEQKQDAVALNEMLLRYDVDMMQSTPSLMGVLVKSSDSLAGLQKLTHLMIGGEPFPASLLRHLKAVTSSRIFNMYGPTETTVWSMVKELTEETQITLGSPIANTQIFIIDKENHLLPVGVPGELCIGGAGMSQGYLNNEELTQEKFITNPFISGERLYRTGDLACWLPNGNLEFLGRMDEQVKVRGYRIELGEIEQTLLAHDEITEAVVVIRSDDGENHLVAYYVSDSAPATHDIKAYLATSLPAYMVPDYYERLEAIPLTPNGKVNKKQLPVPELSILDAYQAPTNETEEKLVQLWSDILKIPADKISIASNFFQLGGHSLRALMLVNKIREAFDRRIPLNLFFNIPTVRDTARFLATFDEVDSELQDSQEEFSF